MMRRFTETIRATRKWGTAALALLMVVGTASAPEAQTRRQPLRARAHDRQGSPGSASSAASCAPASSCASRPATAPRSRARGASRPAARSSANTRVLSALTMEMSTAEIDALARTPGVLSVSVDAPVKAHTVPVTDGALLQQTLGYVAADGLTGAGVGVAIIDSGLSASADFAGRITAFYDFTLPQGGAVSRPPTDPYGHGTHVAGLVGGNGAQSNGLYKGVAPGVSLIGLRVLGADGSGYTSDVIEAIEFATANRVALGIDVLNLSLGHMPYESAATDPQVLAVNAATAAGLVVVVSAGNDGINPATGLPGYAGIVSPGNAASALTVGASHTMGTDTRADDEIGPYSSRGPTWYEGLAKPDVVAPGHKMVAPYAPGSLLGVTNPAAAPRRHDAIRRPTSA